MTPYIIDHWAVISHTKGPAIAIYPLFYPSRVDARMSKSEKTDIWRDL